MIIYVLSNKKTFGGELDRKRVTNLPHYKGEKYLYRQKFDYQEMSDGLKLNHESLVKTVNSDWISKHKKYFGRDVLKDYNGNDLQPSDYETFLAENTEYPY